MKSFSGPAHLMCALAVFAGCNGRPAAPADDRSTPAGAVIAGPCDTADADEDGHADLACGGDDCNDRNPYVYPGAPDDAWSYTLVDVADRASEDIELAIAADGTVHVAWLPRRRIDEFGETLDVRHARVGTGAPVITELVRGGDTYAFIQPDVAVGLAGDAHVVFFGFDSLQYRADLGDGFAPVDVSAPGRRTGASPHVAIDPDGHVHIIFHRLDETGLYHTTNASGSWESELVDSSVSVNGRGLVIDDEGGLHVLAVSSDYTNGTFAVVSYLVNTGAGWTREEVFRSETLATQATALAVGGDGLPHVLYADGSALTLATREGGGWTTEPVPDISPDAPLDVVADAAGDLHVVGQAGSHLVYAKTSGTGWTTSVIAARPNETDVAIALDPSGQPVIAFAEAALDELYLARPSTAANGIDEDCDGNDG